MKKIIHVASIDAPRSKVFAAIKTEKGLSSWWSNRVEAEEEEGGRVRFTFVEDFNPVMEVVKLESDERLEWKCVDGHGPWKDNRFTFALEDTEGRTQLTFAQDYATELSDVAYGTYNFNWGYYLHSLKEYCETGRGKPFDAT